jgi:hypothetical protein
MEGMIGRSWVRICHSAREKIKQNCIGKQKEFILSIFLSFYFGSFLTTALIF